MFKALIAQKEEIDEETWDLNTLKAKVEALRLREIPEIILEKLEQLPSLKSQNSSQAIKEVVDIYYIIVDFCRDIASQIYLLENYKQIENLEPGKFYTNSLGKIYRCIKVEADEAEIILFDEVMGNTLDVVFSQNREYWTQYYLVEDKTIIENFEKRYRDLSDNNSNKNNKNDL